MTLIAWCTIPHGPHIHPQRNKTTLEPAPPDIPLVSMANPPLLVYTYPLIVVLPLTFKLFIHVVFNNVVYFF